METNQENKFEYTYSAKRQEEIEKIKSKYIPQEEDKMETLRKLDRSVELSATMIVVIIGLIGTLIFGAGLSLALVWTDTFMIQGIVISLIGMAIMAAAFPVYKIIVKKRREKIAPQILALTEELLK